MLAARKERQDGRTSADFLDSSDYAEFHMTKQRNQKSLQYYLGFMRSVMLTTLNDSKAPKPNYRAQKHQVSLERGDGRIRDPSLN